MVPPSFGAPAGAPAAPSAPSPRHRARRARWPLVVVPAVLAVLVLLLVVLVSGGSGGGNNGSPQTSVAPSSVPPTSVPATSSSGHSWLGPVLLVLAALVVGFGLGMWLSRRRRTTAPPVPAPWIDAPLATPLTVTAGPGDRVRAGTVFISHDFDTDHPLAVRLANDLRPRVDVWIAPESIQPGESWLMSVERGLNASAVFLALLSKAALASPWVLKEIQAAMELEVERRMHLLPVQVEDCDLPLLLRTYQVLRLSGGYTRVVDETVRLATARRS